MLPARRLTRKFILIAVIPGCGLLLYWCARLSWADYLARSSDVSTIARAVSMAPGDADLNLRLATAQQSAGMDFAPALESAIALEPWKADAWMRLGLAAEMRGDLRRAESYLREAARVSRRFTPRWALANYYFRRGEVEHFWTWARASLIIGSGNLNPVFQLCWQTSQQADVILDRAIPKSRLPLQAYVGFLLQQGRLAASEEPARQLSEMATADDQPLLLNWCDLQLGTGSTAAAVAVWNRLCNKRIFPYRPLDPKEAPLTDGGFAGPFGSGFSWRLGSAPGVTAGTNPSPHNLWINFSGDQPEVYAALLQLIPLTNGETYRLRFEYRTADLPASSGLGWMVNDARTGAEISASGAWLHGAEWKHDELRFRAPVSGLARLTLLCRRLPGATRVRGTVELRSASLERVS